MSLRAVLLGGCLALWTGVSARAASPESPQVQQILKRATDFLLKSDSATATPGHDALLGLALYKAGFPADHPRVKQSIEAARAFARTVPRQGLGNSCYGAAICAMLLSDVEPQLYHAEIELIVDGMLHRQQPNGCWSYHPYTYDDTSQTQYAVLCLWTAAQTGHQVPGDALERAANWLITTQHPEGGWSYIPLQMPSIGVPRNYAITHSMTSAGAGMAYMLAHLFGLGNTEAELQTGLPSALKPVGDPQRRGLFPADRVNRTAFQNTMRAADNWFANNMRFDVPFWTHYYMYGFERYKSFQDLVNGQKVKDPAWYFQGVEFLRRTQQPDGAWKSVEATGSSAHIDTAFAVLFLARSSRQTIEKTLLEGQLLSGKGLPKDLSDIRLERGQVVSSQAVRDVEGLLKLLENEDDELDPTELRDKLILDPDPARRSQQLERLRGLVDHKNYLVRLRAVKALGSVRDLNNVPALIHALSDPDPRVSKAALDALRLTSRKLVTPDLPPDPNSAQVRSIQDYWRKWYLSLQPDAPVPD